MVDPAGPTIRSVVAQMREVLHDHLRLHESRNLFPGFRDERRLGLFA